MSIRLKAKFGSTEIEYEGSEDFLKTELPQLLQVLSESLGKIAPAPGVSPPSNNGNGTDAASPSAPGTLEMSTGNIAAKLGCKSGSDLAIAACAHLTLVVGQEVFERKDILEDMKTATAYYEENHSKNLSTTLTSMVKGDKLVERSKNKFAMQASERQRIEAKLA